MKALVLFLMTSLGTVTYLVAQEQVDILIVGGGAGGTTAGIQAAKMGTRVKVLEKTPWLGGMLTSAGVSAIDGNHEMPSGLWGTFRQKLYDHYGGPKALATGWVSHTLFEPAVGNTILQQMADIPNLEVSFNTSFTSVQKEGDSWKVFYEKNGKPGITTAKILIDATETGELLPLVGARFRLGMDAKSDTREKEAPEEPNNIVQDLTYVVILEDKGNIRSKQGLVKKPIGYNASDFECACKREGGEMFGSVSDCQQMLNYGKLPNNKYMMNWPNCGNDFYLNWPELTSEERNIKLKEAKAFSQGFVYYIQNELGFKNLRLAEEFPTKDGFPMIAYDREARRIRGQVFLTVDHLERPYDFDFYKTGVAVGDYPIDHHHDKNPETPQIEFINIKVPSYTIPMGCLIPEKIENFLVAEKNISVSNIVNGTTRLQPVVLGIGQAAGAVAATAVLNNKKTNDVSVRKVQQALLKNRAYLMPFIDVKPNDPAFVSIQRIGASGVLKGFGVPYKWANQTWFYPERIVSEYEWQQGLLTYFPQLETLPASGKGVTISFLEDVIKKVHPDYMLHSLRENWKSWGVIQNFDQETPLTRRTISIITDKALNPFDMEVDFSGKLLNNN